MDEIKRREFLVGTGLAALGVWSVAGKLVGGGENQVLVPPGAGSVRNFKLRCVGCQACVQKCPQSVLRSALGGDNFKGGILQPRMKFDLGYCRPECTACGEVCPTGAIQRVAMAEKRVIHIGRAVVNYETCNALHEKCNACMRRCPVQAITLVPPKEKNAGDSKIPVVDEKKCIGCGACEYVCPVSPKSAIKVEGFVQHFEEKPMSDMEVLAEAKRLFASREAAVVVVQAGVIVARGNGRGLSPLLDLCEREPYNVASGWVIDKVIGKAAAAICVAYGAKRVHGELMCESARDLLQAYNVECSTDNLVPQILNRNKTGLCPLEMSVKDLTEVKDMIPAIRAKLELLRKAAENAQQNPKQ